MIAALLGVALLGCTPADESPPLTAPAPVAAIDLDDPTQCAPCHGAVVAEWQESMHARAHHDADPIYGAMRSLRMAKQGAEVGAACPACHNPRSPDAPDAPEGRAGVSCAACHLVAEHHPDRGPGARALVYDEAILRSGRHLPAGASPVHGTGAASPFLADGQSLCLACHDATYTPAGVAACTTGPEHRAGGGASCTSCHMARTEGPNGVVSARDHHASHRFAGPHRAWYQDDRSPLSEAVDVALHRDGTTLVATLTNRTGHAVPTGFPGRQMVLSLTGRDVDGAEVWTHRTADGSAPASPFHKVTVDAEGKPTPAPFAVRLAADTRLRVGETRRLTWDLPPNVVSVEAQLHMRLLPPSLARALQLSDQVENTPRLMISVEDPP